MKYPSLTYRTALHWAAKRGRKDVIEVLLDHGADSEVLTEKGETALTLALTPEIRQLLGGGEMNGSVNDSSLPIMPNYIKVPSLHNKDYSHTSNGTLPRRQAPQETVDGKDLFVVLWTKLIAFFTGNVCQLCPFIC